MKHGHFNILLADDDDDDCMLFKDVLSELSSSAILNRVANGVELMNFLEKNTRNLPDCLFLDLNMPLKTGIDCLSEIKQNEHLNQLHIIIYSTSSNPEVINTLYHKGAQYYIRKPADFGDLKSVVSKAIRLAGQQKTGHVSIEDFMIQP